MYFSKSNSSLSVSRKPSDDSERLDDRSLGLVGGVFVVVVFVFVVVVGPRAISI